MPIPPPLPSSPYPILDDVLDLARVRINDAIQSIGGDTLTDDQPFTQVMTNAAWLKLQQFLGNMGYSRNRKRTVLTGLPIVGSQDPASETVLNWEYFYDGVSYFVPPNTPVLPQDFIAPLRIGERQSVGYQPTLTQGNSGFRALGNSPDGNPNWRKTTRNGWFDWRGDGIIMPGSIQPMDLEIYYSAYMSDFITVGATPWYQQPVPIMRSQSALANYIAAEYANPRGDMDAAGFMTQAEQDARLIFNNSEVPLRQRTNISRRSYAGNVRNGFYGWGGGY